ncbi:hypothetical protein [Clostridium sp. C2-6-12]|uniref:hypothetical protein n=1 Tax=Clostridium sp. C2-6-12 TaxID=2698832 RepID=UPI00136D794B|nr:hypothetical protein [Clostridium sp. C2-6-12]
MPEVKLPQFPMGVQVSGEDMIPAAQNGVSGLVKVKDVRNIGSTIEEGGTEKTASNENLKSVNKKVNDLATHVDDSFNAVNQNFTNLENEISSANTAIGTANQNINNHQGDADIHVTKEKQAKWDGYGTQLSEKANNTDNSRTTTAKTVTGAINELNSNKVNQSSLDDISGYYMLGYKSVALSVPSGSETIIAFDQVIGTKTSLLTDSGKTITLPAGTYLINAKVTLESNATGYRKLRLCGTDGTFVAGWQQAVDNKNAVSGSESVLEINRIVSITNTSKFALYAFQNSGVALNLYSGDNLCSVTVRRIV